MHAFTNGRIYVQPEYSKPGPAGCFGAPKPKLKDFRDLPGVLFVEEKHPQNALEDEKGYKGLNMTE